MSRLQTAIAERRAALERVVQCGSVGYVIRQISSVDTFDGPGAMLIAAVADSGSAADPAQALRAMYIYAQASVVACIVDGERVRIRLTIDGHGSEMDSESEPVEDLPLATLPGRRRVDVERVHRAGGGAWISSPVRRKAGLLGLPGAGFVRNRRADGSRELPELRELQEHVVAVEHRHDESGRAVGEAEA